MKLQQKEFRLFVLFKKFTIFLNFKNSHEMFSFDNCFNRLKRFESFPEKLALVFGAEDSQLRGFGFKL